MKRPFLLLALMLIVLATQSQTTAEPREFYSEEFSWRIKIPAGYNALTGEEIAAAQKKGAEAIEKVNDVEVGNGAKVIFAIRSNQFNYFESNWQPFDASLGNHKEQCNLVNGLLYKTFKAQLKDLRVDSVSFVESISGLEFQGFLISMYLPNDMIMEMQVFSHVFGRKEFTVVILSTDKKTKDELLAAWRNSVFEATKINERRIR